VRRALVSLILLAVAGISEASDRRDAPARADVQCTGTPTLPETLVAPNAPPPGPVLDGALVASADRVEVRVVDVSARSKVDRRLFLIDAQVFEKYLAFRESLTSP
jgi:hypothetical protein